MSDWECIVLRTIGGVQRTHTLPGEATEYLPVQAQQPADQAVVEGRGSYGSIRLSVAVGARDG